MSNEQQKITKNIEVRRWDNNNIIYSGEFESIEICIKNGLKKGKDFFRADLIRADLTGANLIDANLIDADLSDADLRDANLTGANLTGADLSDADLRDANLTGANLTGANLIRADLRDADLTDADLRDANLTGANLPELSVSINAGYPYFLFICPQVVVAGCQSHSADEWRKFSEAEIRGMDSGLIEFYPTLLNLMDFFLNAGEKGNRPEWLSEIKSEH